MNYFQCRVKPESLNLDIFDVVGSLKKKIQQLKLFRFVFRMESSMNSRDQSVSNDHRQRAISKLKFELNVDICGAVREAQSCGLWDLLRLLYEFRLARLCMILPEYREAMSAADVATFHLNDDAMKYAISLAVKHGKWDRLSAINTPLADFDINRVHKLEGLTRYINAKFETEILFNIAEVRVSGARDETCEVDLHAGLCEPSRNMQMQFGLRIEKFTRDAKNDPVPIPQLLERFRRDYSALAELYEQDNGISMEVFCQGMLDIHEHLVAKGFEAEANLLGDDGDRVNPLLAETFIKLSRTFIMTDIEMEGVLNPEFLAYLRRNPFDPDAVSDSELRYHYISRRPFIIGQGFAIFSPELVFDSVLGNARYTFLESITSKQKFMEQSASQFIDDIASVALVRGYRVIGRDIYLKEGRRDIGDIDLFLWNEELDHCLLIEAKNHMLPLPVYFRNPSAVDEHISRNRDWEMKVQRRISHLKGEGRSFCVIGNWDYLVVSLMPEPLSHVTELLVLSLDEFGSWLSESPRPARFSELHTVLHTPEAAQYSVEELQQMQDEGFLLMKGAIRNL